MKVSRIYRLLRLVTLLQRGRSFSVNELAEELGVSRRTVFRDLNMLEMAHIPYYFDADAGGYRIAGQFFLPPVNLTLSEALAVLVLTGRVRGKGHLPLLDHGGRAALKLESVLPGSIRRHVGTILDKLAVSLGPVSDHDDVDRVFHEVAAAIADRLVCEMTYRSFFEQDTICTRVHPLRLVFLDRGYYLIAYSEMHKEVRTFKLVRIESLDVTGEHFEPHEDGDPDEHFGQAWRMIPEGRLYDVHVRFSAKVAGNVAEVRWHESQRVTQREDGSIDFHATVDGLREISWWILGYGDQAEVLAPPELRSRLAETARAMLARYDATAEDTP